MECPNLFVILDAADAWVFLSLAAPIFIWGIWTGVWRIAARADITGKSRREREMLLLF